jgi:hypothetical protein
MSRKIYIYLKGASKCIVLTDNDETDLKSLITNISNALSQTNIVELSTSTDVFVSRPNEISAIHIQHSEKKSNDENLLETKISDNDTAIEEIEDLKNINVYDNSKDNIPTLDLSDIPQNDSDIKLDIQEEPQIDGEEIRTDDEIQLINEVAEWHSELETT